MIREKGMSGGEQIGCWGLSRYSNNLSVNELRTRGQSEGARNIPETFREHRRKSERRVRVRDLLCSRSYPKESWPMVGDRMEESGERTSVLGEGAVRGLLRPLLGCASHDQRYPSG